MLLCIDDDSSEGEALAKVWANSGIACCAMSVLCILIWLYWTKDGSSVGVGKVTLRGVAWFRYCQRSPCHHRKVGERGNASRRYGGGYCRFIAMEGRGCVVRKAIEMTVAWTTLSMCGRFVLKLYCREVFPSLGTIPPNLYGGYILEIRS